MARKEHEEDDPVEMIGVQLSNQTEEQLRDMALCFAEEFVREGWSEEKLLAMFKNPLYQGPYMAWKQKGDEYVRSVIDDALSMWRPTKRFYNDHIPEKRDASCSNKGENDESSL